MKRDMDLIRAILLEIEKLPDDLESHNIEMENATPEEVTYHVRLLAQAGLIEAEDFSTFAGTRWQPRGLTWNGHEFLDAARSDTVWRKAKEIVIAGTGTLTLEALKIALPHAIRSLITLV
jgi:hypothetical protein